MYSELIQLFGKIGTKLFGKKLQSLKELVEKSNLPIIYEKYIGKLFFYAFICLNVSFVFFLYFFLIFWKLNFAQSFIISLILTSTLTWTIATVFYLYPFYKYSRQMKDIERNMPFGISYMNIISKSGVPPEQMIKYIAEDKEFGEFSKEFERIYKQIILVGKDVTSSISEIAFRTPSEKFKNFLLGLNSTILSGGNINLYLSEESRKEIDVYRERQRKYTTLMSFLADIYIVVFLIVPLVIMILLTTFSLITSTFFSFNIPFLMRLLVYVFVPVSGAIYLIILGLVKV